MDYKKDYYSILEVNSKATTEILRASYRRLAKLYHPDKNPGDPDAEERFKTINEAYEILSNEITRHIYDSYREKNAPPLYSSSREQGTYSPGREAFRTTKTRTYTVKRDKRIYVHGTIEVKFHGEPELSDVYIQQREQRFTIYPTEVLVTIISSDIYKGRPPGEYESGYSVVDLFATPLKQPVNCRIITGQYEEYYQLDLYDIRVKDPVIKDVTRHEQFSFGTLQGELLAYVLHQYEEDVSEEYTEYTGATGHVETKTESAYVYSRQQFYTKDGGTYWGEWKRAPTRAGRYHTGADVRCPVSGRQDGWWPGWWWLIIFLIWIRSLFHNPGYVVRSIPGRKFDSVSSGRTIVRRSGNKRDTLITHHLRWQDRDSSRYEILLSIPLSAVNESTYAHEQMDEQQYALQGINAVYHHMLDTDKDHIKPIAATFDSLAGKSSLSREREASMIVSCIQSIPYSLIIDKSCSSSYTDDYVNQYLSRCKGDCCKGYSKFGVQSPVEFVGDLKGDCDTRALVLYDILGKLGYKVALMTSNYYKHALIAVCLDKAPQGNATAILIDGRTYYLWETTARGFGPGQIPAALSNLNYWNISLIQ